MLIIPIGFGNKWGFCSSNTHIRKPVVLFCEQVAESLKHSHTKPLGCVWCQRAHPDTSRVKTKRNAKVSTHLIMPLTTRLMMLLISCEQVVESLKQSRTKPTGCVWCQRAHPDTSRVTTKRNANVSAIGDIRTTGIVSESHNTAYSMYCRSDHRKCEFVANRLWSL